MLFIQYKNIQILMSLNRVRNKQLFKTNYKPILKRKFSLSLRLNNDNNNNNYNNNNNNNDYWFYVSLLVIVGYKTKCYFNNKIKYG
jgi:hypothetical protein